MTAPADRPPHVRALVSPRGRVLLCSWGRAGAGDWWACIAAVARIERPDPDNPTLVMQTGWVPATGVRPHGSDDYRNVPRVELPPDPADWPAPEIDPYVWRWERTDFGRCPEGFPTDESRPT